jgi:hypothetical protein
VARAADRAFVFPMLRLRGGRRSVPAEFGAPRGRRRERCSATPSAPHGRARGERDIEGRDASPFNLARIARSPREHPMERVADGVWVADAPFSFFGVRLGTRMTVVRLRDGGLFVHSPVPLTPALRAEVDALGSVRHIVAPNIAHHLYVGEWKEAYPDALLDCSVLRHLLSARRELWESRGGVTNPRRGARFCQTIHFQLGSPT